MHAAVRTATTIHPYSTTIPIRTVEEVTGMSRAEMSNESIFLSSIREHPGDKPGEFSEETALVTSIGLSARCVEMCC